MVWVSRPDIIALPEAGKNAVAPMPEPAGPNFPAG